MTAYYITMEIHDTLHLLEEVITLQELSFSIPVSGVIRIDDGSITITVNRAETVIAFEPVAKKETRFSLGNGRTLFDIVLDTARDMIGETGTNSFSASELYHRALEEYPNLKRNSWNSHVIACAPNHPSYKHHISRRDFFSYSQNGRYRLNPGCLIADNSPRPILGETKQNER